MEDLECGGTKRTLLSSCTDWDVLTDSWVQVQCF